MALTCSVLGHRYGDREHIEERDRQGSEEIIAIREVKTCDRCGDELVVSESKEVVAVPGADSRDVGESIERAPEPSTPNSVPESSMPDDTLDPNEGPDDGLILTDNDEREPGAWPDVDEDSESEKPPGEDTTDEPGATTETEDWPDVEGEDEGFDVTSRNKDPDLGGQFIEAAPDEPQGGVERTDSGFYRAGTIDSPAESTSDNVHTEYFCPRCDWSAKSLTTSVRRGDICPDCRTGYISERDA